MAVYYSVMGGLILLIIFVTFWAVKWRLNDREARRLMNRLYCFVAMAGRKFERGEINRAQQTALIGEIAVALCGSSVLKSLRAVDAVIHDFNHGEIGGRPLALITDDEDQDE